MGLLFGDVTGGTGVVMATQLMIDSAYSRDAERAADLYAAHAMVALGRSPSAMGKLLKRIDKGSHVLPALLQCHPQTDERLAALMRQDPLVSKDTLLTDEEWQALKAVCKE